MRRASASAPASSGATPERCCPQSTSTSTGVPGQLGGERPGALDRVDADGDATALGQRPDPGALGRRRPTAGRPRTGRRSRRRRTPRPRATVATVSPTAPAASCRPGDVGALVGLGVRSQRERRGRGRRPPSRRRWRRSTSASTTRCGVARSVERRQSRRNTTRRNRPSTSPTPMPIAGEADRRRVRVEQPEAGAEHGAEDHPDRRAGRRPGRARSRRRENGMLLTHRNLVDVVPKASRSRSRSGRGCCGPGHGRRPGSSGRGPATTRCTTSTPASAEPRGVRVALGPQHVVLRGDDDRRRQPGRSGASRGEA